jgi:hypothetical protein
MKLQSPMACWHVAIDNPKEKPLVWIPKVLFNGHLSLAYHQNINQVLNSPKIDML